MMNAMVSFSTAPPPISLLASHNRWSLPLMSASSPTMSTTGRSHSVSRPRMLSWSSMAANNRARGAVLPSSVPVRVAHELLQAGYRYLDVRTVDEFDAGHPEGATNVPYMLKTGSGMMKNPDFLGEVSSAFGRDDEIIIGCQTGKRSQMAAFELSLAMARFLSLPQPSVAVAVAGPRCALPNAASGAKHADRLLSSLYSASTSSDPYASASADRLARKFVAASSKSTALHTLSHLLSISSPLALFIYERISQTNWFNWNPKLAASVAALLEKLGRSVDAEALISESAAKIKSPRALSLFYCDLIEAFSEHGLKKSVLELYARLRELPCTGRRPYESMIKGLCLMEAPAEAEEMLKEMAFFGLRPSAFEFRLVLQIYGKLGSFEEMKRVLGAMEEAGFTVDTVCANVILSCYGNHGQLSEVVSWIRKMKETGIACSARTFNSVFNSCPSLNSMIQDIRSVPLSTEALIKEMEKDSSSPDEALLVKELIGSSFLNDILEWSSSEVKLDLHGFHAASAYVIILQWMEELRLRLPASSADNLEISVVCGQGKHGDRRGESPIKKLVSEIMFLTNSSMKIDRKNTGRFTARGKAVRQWLC